MAAEETSKTYRPHANVSGVVAQSVRGNAQVGGIGIAQFGGKREIHNY